jgi:cytosine deaminase
MTYELQIEAGRTAREQKRARLGVRNGKIHRLDEKEHAQGFELGGQEFLLAPGFVEPHYHLDKCFLSEHADPRRSLSEQLRRYEHLKKGFTAEMVAERAIRAGRLLSQFGITHMRTFADVDVFSGLSAVEGVLAARDRLRPWIDVQVVAFAQHGVFVHDGTLSLLIEALGLGVEGIGGHPQVEGSTTNGQRQIDTLFELAARHEVLLDFHVDETDDQSSMWIERCASLAAESYPEGRVTLAHANTLSLQGAETRGRVYDLLQAAEITLVSSPTSALLFRHLGEPAGPRGIPPIRELLDRGINVAIGQEVFASQFSAHLRVPDPLITGQIMAYTAQLADDEGLAAVFRMLGENGAKALRLPSYGIEEGKDADLVLLNAGSVQDALTDCTERFVVRAGRIVAHLNEVRWTEPDHVSASQATFGDGAVLQ